MIFSLYIYLIRGAYSYDIYPFDQVHEGVVYKCDQCDYETHGTKNLRRHKTRVHDAVRFPCDQCDYKGTTADYLKHHKEAKHMGIRHFCDQEWKSTKDLGTKSCNVLKSILLR